jgi:hypothetical protein
MLNEEIQSKEWERILCDREIWGSRSGGAEGSVLLKCYAVSLGKSSSTFRWIMVNLYSKSRELFTRRQRNFPEDRVFLLRPKDNNKTNNTTKQGGRGEEEEEEQQQQHKYDQREV